MEAHQAIPIGANFLKNGTIMLLKWGKNIKYITNFWLTFLLLWKLIYTFLLFGHHGNQKGGNLAFEYRNLNFISTEIFLPNLVHITLIV